MQFKIAFVSLALATLAAATPTPTPAPRNEPASSCSTGPIQCCDTVTSFEDSPTALKILLSLGIVLQDVDVLVGLSCSPITVIGVGSNGCSAQAVCCEDNSHGGLISIGCVPVQL